MKRLATATILYLVTTSIVFAGLHLGSRLLKPCPHGAHVFDPEAGAFANWDGQWYCEIAAKGYTFNPTTYSSVAFFPGYPVVGSQLSRATGLSVDVALLLVSNLSFLAALCLLAAYVRGREPESDADPLAEGYAMLALAAIPSSFFFRMTYSESLFLLVAILVLMAMQRRWHPAAAAALVGLATSIRPVGVGLIPVALAYAWLWEGSTPRRILRLIAVAPLSVWGIGLFSAYLAYKYKDPLAFSGAQVVWNRHAQGSLFQRVFDLLSLEPIVAIFDPESMAYWAKHDRHQSPVFTMRFYDTGFFLVAVALTVVGAFRNWITGREVLAAAGLLLLPYATNGYATYMNSMGRYSTVAFPIYLVMARGLKALPAPIAAVLIGASLFFLGVYTALFAAWYVVI